MLETEFDKRADPQTKLLTKDGFNSCLKVVQSQFEFSNLAGSPLAIGLFEHFAKDRPGGRAVLSITEYASAMAVLFNSMDSGTLVAITAQAIMRWYQVTHRPSIPPTTLNDDILVAYFEASWLFAWTVLSARISSNFCLNGKNESEAIERFYQSHAKYFSLHPNELNLGGGTPSDKTIVVSIGDEEVHVPTTFSFISKQKGAQAIDFTPGRSLNRASNAYPEL